MPWTLLSLLSALLTLGAALPILRHAFRRSVGTGVMVLLIPGYVLLYAFTQFEHPRRHWLVPLMLGGLILSGVFAGLALPPAPST
jgi:benzodiazapine receptor